MQVFNATGCATQWQVGLDQDGFEHMLVVAKAGFALGPADQDGWMPAQEQPGSATIALGDRYHAEPSSSSLQTANDMVPFKPATDVLVTGHVRPEPEHRRLARVRLRVGAIDKRLCVLGPRRWERGPLGGYRASLPEAFEQIPLHYELAFGGADDSVEPMAVCQDNPVGIGFRGKLSRRRPADVPLPAIEYESELIASPEDRPRPAGLGPLAPAWGPRRCFTGTMDSEWRQAQAPLLAADFDPRFHQAAPPDQIYPGYLIGGEQVRLDGVGPGNRRLAFSVPSFAPEIILKLGRERVALASRCDTLVIDADQKQVTLTARANYRIHGQLSRLQWIQVRTAKVTD